MTAPASLSRSSGDLLADRRFGYAQALLEDGAAAAALDLLDQTLERVPDWVPAWMARGLAAERLGRPADAAAAFARAAALDADGVHGAGLHLARLTAPDTASAMSPAFVAALFDDYADRFDAHLVGALGYCGPALLAAAIAADAGPGWRARRAIDLGCGTGLMAPVLRPHVDSLAGVDLSPRMIERARRRALYDRLETGDMVAVLAAEPPGTADLLVAADVLAYVGPLGPVLAAAARVLRSGGRLAVTLQRGSGAPVRLGADMRFSHAPAYVEDALGAAGLGLRSMAEAATRRDAGQDVPGLVVVARKP